MIIDVHHHLNKLYYPKIEEYLDDIIRVSEEFRVDKFCISGVGDFYDNYDNKDVEYAFGRLPDKIVGFAFLELDVDKPDMVGQFYDRGFRGIKLIRPVKDYDDESYFPIYEKIARCKMPILFHTGIVGARPKDAQKKVSSARMRPIFLETIARRFPELFIIGAHFGHPWFDEASEVMRVNENVFFDLSGIVGTTYIEKPLVFFTEKMIRQPVYEKFVFGTDALIRDFGVPYEKHNAIFEELKLSESIKQRIMGENIARMLGLTI